jgi:glycine hydroxymethyltransferase
MKNHKDLKNTIIKEARRQNEGLVMIPSENMPTAEVLKIMGTPLNNKYSEGYPQKRYYTGNTFVDEIENFAIEKAKELFEMEHANVQPHSGSNANFAALTAVLEPGDKILSMSLQHGGHLSHGDPINIIGKLFSVIQYGVDKKTERIDYESLNKLAQIEKPKLIISGASAYPREIDFDKITEIAHSIDAIHLADISHVAGLIIAGAHKSAKSADIITTTTHKTLRGPRGGLILCKRKYADKIDKAVFPKFQGGPMEHIIAAKAANFLEAETNGFKEYQIQIVKNSKVLEKMFKDNNIKMVSGGTDTHLLLIDLTDLKINGHEAAKSLEKALIYVNKNAIPFDTKKPYYPSGIRLGTPFLTARGMKEGEMEKVGTWICQILKKVKDGKLQDEIKDNVLKLTTRYPIYGEYL